MAKVAIHRARKAYAGSLALNDVSLEIGSGEFVTLLGPSGCGKSTTLRAVAGLVEIDAGRVVIGERDVTRVPIHHRDIGMVFQNLALFPHMTVAENVAFGLKMRGIARRDRMERVAAALALVHLPDHAGRFPHQLSGGQQQRVAIARALVLDPGVLLLDEPFSALDRKLRDEMQVELREITRRLGITSLFVTHDQEEALTLSDRIAVMNDGRIEQIGTPDDVYMRPATRFVADFMGAANVLDVDVVGRGGGSIALRWRDVGLSAVDDASAPLMSPSVGVALRPDLIRVTPGLNAAGAPAGGSNVADGRVISSVDHGAFASLVVALDSDAVLKVRRPKSEQAATGALVAGDAVTLAWDARNVVILRDAPSPP